MFKSKQILALLMLFGLALVTTPALADDLAADTDTATAQVSDSEAGAEAADAALPEGVMMKDGLPVLGVPIDGDLDLQPAASIAKERIHSFHTLLLVLITAISVFVMALLGYVIWRFNEKANPKPATFTHNTMLEVVWTGVPALIVIVIMVLSMKLLTTTETVPEDAELTLKVTGYQWYWGYEYPDQQIENYESRMIRDADGNPDGNPRLLEVDEYAVIPVNTPIRIVVAANDVIHSATVPAFGFKKDAMPGTLNETWVEANKEGIFYGQCSEICGIDHAYMPLGFKVVSRAKFNEWVLSKTAGDINGENPPKLLDLSRDNTTTAAAGDDAAPRVAASDAR